MNYEKNNGGMMMVEAIPLDDEKRKKILKGFKGIVNIFADGVKRLCFNDDDLRKMIDIYTDVLPAFISPASGIDIEFIEDSPLIYEVIQINAIRASEIAIEAFSIYLEELKKYKYLRDRREHIVSMTMDDLDKRVENTCGDSFLMVGGGIFQSLDDDVEILKKYTTDKKFIKKYEKFILKTNKKYAKEREKLEKNEC